MATILNTSVLLAVILFCCSITTSAARTKLYSITSNQDSISKLSSSGACKLMIETQGYICQEHKVTTEDGYILSMQRMPAGRSGKPANKPPVLLQHGLMSDGLVWYFNSPDESLAFILADNGYDVWISNTRGTRYSQGHTSLSPKDRAYWNWSWDELAAYDLPATFNYVHQQTGQKLYYVGHSLGTLMVFAAFSQDKLLNMLRAAALLSPVAYLNQIPPSLTRAAAQLFMAEELFWLGMPEFLPKGQVASTLLDHLCDKPGVNCTDLMDAFTGPNCCVNSSKIIAFVNTEPQATATKNLIHLSQSIRNGVVAMYDYGNKYDNMKYYKQPTPPVYNLTSIPNDVPLFLGYGRKDILADMNDVRVLLNKLEDHDPDKLVLLYREEYAHADFVLGVNANQLVYAPLMSFFDRN